MDVKKILPYFAIVATISGAFGYLYKTFTPLPVTQAIAADVQKIKDNQYKKELKGELYWLYDQERKYPADEKIKRKIKELEEELEELKK
jgi:hypothetical protein